MTEFLLFLLVIFLVAETVKFVYNIYYIKELSVQVRDRLKLIIHEVKVEERNGIEYWFDSETKQFLGQGKTEQELINHVKSRFPNHIFLFDKGILAGPVWAIQTKFNVKEFVDHEK
jgi:hypothetical protein